jgi:hypothetical protein
MTSPHSDSISLDDHGYANRIPNWILKKKEKVPESLTRLKNAISADIAIKDKMQYFKKRNDVNAGDEFVEYYSKEETTEINREEFLRFEEATLPEKVKIFVIESSEQLKEGLEYAFLTGRPKYVGFDCEWLPENYKKRIDLVQLAFDNCVLLIRACQGKIGKEQVPALLKQILEDEKILKFCQDPEYEVNLLQVLWGFEIKGMVDTACIGDLFCCRPFGLVSLVALFLRKRLRKDPIIQCSNWRVSSLSTRQINYAALDAWISKQVALCMLEEYCISWNLDSVEQAIEHVRLECQSAELIIQNKTGSTHHKRKADESGPAEKKAKTEAQILRAEKKKNKKKQKAAAENVVASSWGFLSSCVIH